MDINSGLLTLLGELRVQVEEKTQQIGNLVQVNNDLAQDTQNLRERLAVCIDDNNRQLLEINDLKSRVSIMNHKIETMIEENMKDTTDASRL